MMLLEFGKPESERLVDGVAVDRKVGGPTDALVMPRRCRVPLLGKIEPERAWRVDRLERQPRHIAQFLGQFAVDRVDDVDLAHLERGQPGRLLRDHLEDEPFDARDLAPVRLERLEHQFNPGTERREFVRTGPNGRLLEAVVADLLDVFLGDDPTGAGRTRVIGQEVGPRLLEPKADMPSVGGLDRGYRILDHFRRGAAIAL